MAKRYLENGDYVIVTGYNKEHINETKEELNKYKERTLFIQVDVTKEESIINMIQIIKEKYGYIDVLINNAAFDKMDSINSYKYEDFEKIIKTNLIGKMFCIKHSIELLKKSKYPSIINISSRLATKPMNNSSAYCCSAAGIIMLTKCAALELAEEGIRVNTISPSLTITPLALKSYSKEEIKEVSNKSLRNRLCEMEDIYNLSEFLITEKADYINGENIDLSGGILLR